MGGGVKILAKKLEPIDLEPKIGVKGKWMKRQADETKELRVCRRAASFSAGPSAWIMMGAPSEGFLPSLLECAMGRVNYVQVGFQFF